MGTLSLCPGVDPELSSIHLPTLAYGAWTSAHRPAGGGRASSAASSSSFHSGVCVACEVFTLAVIYNTHILKNASPSHFKCSHFGSESLSEMGWGLWELGTRRGQRSRDSWA